jgi:hypothetical protein
VIEYASYADEKFAKRGIEADSLAVATALSGASDVVAFTTPAEGSLINATATGMVAVS